MQEDGNQMWLKPNADENDILSIWKYAITVNGYNYANDNLGVDCSDFADRQLDIYKRDGLWQGSFEELRCCLFYEQRRAHWTTDPVGDEVLALQALYRTIVQRWDIEAGDGSS